MENNQEHKIDKIFRETFENQEITPPSDAWTGIHTYTIGQEEKKPKIWLKYVSLATLFLLISGFGMWYFVDSQVIADVNTPVSLSQELVSGDTRSNRKTQIAALEKVGRTLNPAVVKTSNQLARLSIDSFNSEINHRIQDLNSHEALIKTSTIENKPLIIVDSLSNHSNELAESLSYSTDNKLEIIEPKPLIFDNLSGEIQKENENKIMALEKKITDKKEVFKVDSVVYGKKFSFKHPIIKVNLLAYTQSFWTTTGDLPKNIINPDGNYENTYYGFGVSWKINKRLRSGISFSILNNFYNLPSNNGSSKGTLLVLESANNGSTFYNVKTVYGNIQLPTSEFKFADPNKNLQIGVATPLIFDAKPPSNFPSKEFYSNSRINSKSSQIGVNVEYDILSKDLIPKKKNGYDIYILGEVNLQIIRKNGFFTDFGIIQDSNEEKYFFL